MALLHVHLIGIPCLDSVVKVDVFILLQKTTLSDNWQEMCEVLTLPLVGQHPGPQRPAHPQMAVPPQPHQMLSQQS